MKNKKKKRGFTLVELLATITILSVIMIIAIPSVTKIIKKFGNNYYEILEGNVKLAGIDYFTDHKTEIPKYVNESSVIDLKTLAENGYLEEYPKNKNEEEIKEGYVLAYKTGKGKYEYQACITTDDYDEEKNSGYKTDKEYCKDKYTLLNNEILVPPSNGVYALPQKKPENFDNIIRIYDATKQTKESNSIRNISTIEDTVAPVQAIVSCEKDCKDIQTGEYEGNDLQAQLNAIISGYFENATDPYPSALKKFLNKKIKIKYIYQYNGKKTEALFSFVEANEGEAPGEIKVELNKTTETENGGEVYGYKDKDGVWKIIDIPDNTDSINWYNKKIVATVS
ncbi:MAG: prepilin-type N-terminal cleavage/methylation domain-containing protein, partial [Bacilli bacterium]